jgi:hypothetical protein
VQELVGQISLLHADSGFDVKGNPALINVLMLRFLVVFLCRLNFFAGVFMFSPVFFVSEQPRFRAIARLVPEFPASNFVTRSPSWVEDLESFVKCQLLRRQLTLRCHVKKRL